MKPCPDIQTLFPDLSTQINQSVRPYTTFNVGGPCPLLIESISSERLPALIRTLYTTQTPFLVIGQGSNVIISDRGLDAVIIQFCSKIPKLKVHGNIITVSGDTLLDDLARISTEQAIGDLSACSGIPGTVGGGLAGNAGAFGQQIGDHLVSAELLGLDGSIRTVAPCDLEFSYRHSKLKETGEILLSATFELPNADANTLLKERARIMDFRREHHPDWRETPCAGSVFRNIEASSAAERRKAAGYFLEEAGAYTLKVGGAQLYENHANIIIGDETCTAQNIWDLSQQMKQAVLEKFNLELVREVRFLGSF